MEPSNNTETEDETIALKRKRARRVSFADNEITSVHIFRRDDDESSDTPPDSVPTTSSSPGNTAHDPEVLGFFRDLAGDSDDDGDDLKESSSPPSRYAGGNNGGDDNDDGEVVDARDSFLRPVGSPSPGGSSTAGSAASTDDEDGFHGPVSASFIRPERLSDSGASDDNHDLTMDSTAFSLHYRSLARSDSGDIQTPTRFGLQFEEKTPSQSSSPAAPGSFMVLTKSKKQSPQSEVHADAASAGRDSNDMSIVGENLQRYDYDRLSPALDAILAEGSKDLSAVSALVSKATDSPNINGYLMAKGSTDSAMGNTRKHDLSVKDLAEAPGNLSDLNKCSISSPADQVTNDCLHNRGDNTVADASIHQIRTPDSSIKQIKEFVKYAIVPVHKQLDFANSNRETPLKMDEGYQLNVSAQYILGYSEGQVKESNPKDRGQVSDINHKSDQVNGNPIHGFTPFSFAGRKQLFMGSPDSSRYTRNTTPPLKQSGSFVPEVYGTHGAALSSIRKSSSKLKSLETTPSTSTLREGIDRLKRRLSKYSPGSSLFKEKDCEYKQVESLNTCLEEQLFSLTPDNNMHQGLINMDDHGIESFRHISLLSQNEETVDAKKDEENFNLISADISYNDENPNPEEMAASPSQMTYLTREIDFDLADSTVENRKDEIVVVAHDKSFTSPVTLLDRKLSPSIDYKRNCFGELKQLDKQNESVSSGLGHTGECNSPTVANKLELSGFGNSEKPSSPFEAAQANKFAQSESNKKSAESPAKGVLVLSTPIQEASTMLPSQQEAPSELLHNNMQDLSHKGNSDSHGPLNNNYHQAIQVAQSPLTKSGIEISSGKKRKGVEVLRDGNNIDKIGRIDRSPEINKNGNSDLQFVLEQAVYARSEREKLGDQTWNNWGDILKQFLGSTAQLLSPSVDKLNLRLIGMLEDILVHLRKVKSCEILCSEIHSQQKITDPINISRNRRVVEARMLLYNIAYEKAKLQLMHMKRERLLKKVQQLSSGLQESQMMKLNFIPCSSTCEAIDTQANDSHIHTSLLNSEGKRQVSCEKVTTMRQELDTLDWKAKSFSEFFHSYCKMEGHRSCANIIKSVHDYLQKRMSFKCIFQNLKLWEIEDFEHKDGCYRVLLNYRGYIIQRFVVNVGLPGIIIENNLNDVNIGKTFPDMDAFSAFVFVLNPHTTKKRTGSICLAQETQITSSLVSNLLDVVEEVQLARIEIRNLVQAKFYSHSVQQLVLRLSFVDFCSGRKVKVTLDMTCLKCGIYPVEVLPSQIYDHASGEQKSLPSSLAAEIRTAAESVRAGYSRVIRLCRYISQALQACTPSR